MILKADAKELLLKKNIRPSIVRVKVLDYLLNNRTHPSADEIFKALADEIPTLSKTSVYNTLKLFVNENVIREIDIDTLQIHYDAFVDFHGHFKCEKCNKIYDFDIKEPIDAPEGFLVLKKEVYYFGICNKCQKKL